MQEKSDPIAVFDSGIGGLTVLKALRDHFPAESYVYLGDTARLPYGTKSPETVARYSEAMCRELLKFNPKAVVIACNTASTHALPAVTKLASPLPVIGMIDPAADAAIHATKTGRIGVIATFGTIRSGAYAKAIATKKPDAIVISQACQMLVALAEEGWSSNAIARATIHEYLDPLFDRADAPDTLIMGCTHFPVFESLFKEILGTDVTLINSGEAAALTLSASASGNKERGTLTFLATDDPERFAVNAAKFFDQRLLPADITQVDVTS
jgi:glutamate racemase